MLYFSPTCIFRSQTLLYVGSIDLFLTTFSENYTLLSLYPIPENKFVIYMYFFQKLNSVLFIPYLRKQVSALHESVPW
jgi:hypothetical protein